MTPGTVEGYEADDGARIEALMDGYGREFARCSACWTEWRQANVARHVAWHNEEHLRGRRTS